MILIKLEVNIFVTCMLHNVHHQSQSPWTSKQIESVIYSSSAWHESALSGKCHMSLICCSANIFCRPKVSYILLQRYNDLHYLSNVICHLFSILPFMIYNAWSCHIFIIFYYTPLVLQHSQFITNNGKVLSLHKQWFGMQFS